MKSKENQKGQAVLTLLFFMVIAMSIITAVVIVVINTAQAGSNIEQGTVSYYAAETGAENALIRLLRDPNYSGETLNIDNGTVTITVNNGLITSTAQIDDSIRKVQVQTVYNNNVLTVTSWKEIN
jgi:hypothetical protein